MENRIKWEGSVLQPMSAAAAAEISQWEYGASFVEKCVKELRAVKGRDGRILLRVAAWNRRAIKAYQKAGFVYVETIQDEIAFSNHMEDFWVMALTACDG